MSASSGADFRYNRPFYDAVKKAQHRAAQHGLPCDVTEEYLEEIWEGRCPAFGTYLRLPSDSRKGDRSAHVPSLDRIIPSKGYVKGNVCWISFKANQIKSDGTAEDIRMVADWLEEKTQNE